MWSQVNRTFFPHKMKLIFYFQPSGGSSHQTRNISGRFGQAGYSSFQVKQLNMCGWETTVIVVCKANNGAVGPSFSFPVCLQIIFFFNLLMLNTENTSLHACCMLCLNADLRMKKEKKKIPPIFYISFNSSLCYIKFIPLSLSHLDRLPRSLWYEVKFHSWPRSSASRQGRSPTSVTILWYILFLD